MKGILMVGIILSLLLLSGCQNSFNACMDTCVRIDQKNNPYECKSYKAFECIDETLENNKIRRERCFEECK